MPEAAASTRKAQPLVDLSGVDVAFAGQPVLFGLSWRLHAGDHWGIVGANGSGKSSFLGLLAGVHWPAPNGGRRVYNFGDRNLSDAVEAKRRIALVGHELQDRYARWGWNFSALEVVLSGIFRTDVPRRHATDAERERAMQILDELGLGALAERRFLTLSRGEQRRVLIARGMAFEPALLLLDEPGSGLDRAARARLDELVERVSKLATVVIAGHRECDIAATATQLVELAAGRIERAGPRPPPAPAAERLRAPAAPHGDRVTGGATTRLIDLKNVDVWLGGRRILKGLSWRLGRDEHWLVSGDNGAGKSTFLRLLHGQLRPALGGRISWPALANPRNVWALRGMIGYVSAELQAGYRYPTRVRDCIASGFESSIGLTRQPTAPERQRVTELLERFELTAFADRYLSTLSYGQMHRVLIARTLARGPRILLLDEPWEGLDESTRALLGTELKRLMSSGTQIVCVSHIGENGLPLTHELGLEQGRIKHAGGMLEPHEN